MEHVAIVCSRGTLDMAYPGLILANAAPMSGIDATLFFTLWGLDIITKATIDRLHVPTVGNPSMHMPTLLGGLPGMDAFATSMMKNLHLNRGPRFRDVARAECPVRRAWRAPGPRRSVDRPPAPVAR